MPVWKLVAAVILLPLQLACTETRDREILLDGQPLKRHLGNSELFYDGKSSLSISFKQKIHRLEAKVPAVVSVSEDGRYFLHNYGNGSGQVYDVAIYSLPDWHAVDTGSFRQSVLGFAKTHGCKVEPDQISILFEDWSESAATVRTEDFTRHEGCSMINRTWTIRLRQQGR